MPPKRKPTARQKPPTYIGHGEAVKVTVEKRFRHQEPGLVLAKQHGRIHVVEVGGMMFQQFKDTKLLIKKPDGTEYSSFGVPVRPRDQLVMVNGKHVSDYKGGLREINSILNQALLVNLSFVSIDSDVSSESTDSEYDSEEDATEFQTSEVDFDDDDSTIISDVENISSDENEEEEDDDDDDEEEYMEYEREQSPRNNNSHHRKQQRQQIDDDDDSEEGESEEEENYDDPGSDISNSHRHVPPPSIGEYPRSNGDFNGPPPESSFNLGNYHHDLESGTTKPDSTASSFGGSGVEDLHAQICCLICCIIGLAIMNAVFLVKLFNKDDDEDDGDG